MASPSVNVQFVYSPIWQDSLVSAVKDTPNILQKIDEFRKVKSENPIANFGSNDGPFISDGIYKRYLPKARKAKLSNDMSIVYELSGVDPKIIYLYGVFTHANLGTGQPANFHKQKSMAKSLYNIRN